MHKPKRIDIAVEIYSQLRKPIDEIVARNDMRQGVVMTRMVEWFVSQPEMIQAVVLGMIPAEHTQEACRRMLEQMTKAREQPASAEGVKPTASIEEPSS